VKNLIRILIAFLLLSGTAFAHNGGGGGWHGGGGGGVVMPVPYGYWHPGLLGVYAVRVRLAARVLWVLRRKNRNYSVCLLLIRTRPSRYSAGPRRTLSEERPKKIRLLSVEATIANGELISIITVPTSGSQAPSGWKSMWL
jgi:hypothetical protein